MFAVILLVINCDLELYSAFTFINISVIITGSKQRLLDIRAHGLCDTAIRAVFRSAVLARFFYASPAWWGFARAQDCQKVGFLHRSTWARFCSKNLPNFSDICLEGDKNLFRKVLHNPQHVASTSSPSSCHFPQLFP